MFDEADLFFDTLMIKLQPNLLHIGGLAELRNNQCFFFSATLAEHLFTDLKDAFSSVAVYSLPAMRSLKNNTNAQTDF